MIAYQITFEGIGFNLSSEDGKPIGGFYVSVVASAPDPEQAFDIAYEKLINSQAYQDLVSSGEHPNAELSVDGYSELTDQDLLEVAEISGFVFYPSDEETGVSSAVKH